MNFSKRSSLRCALGALSLAVASSVAPAWAQQPAADSDPRVQEGRAHFRDGVAASNARHFAEAAMQFEWSLRLRPHPITLYNAAESRFNAGDREQAVLHLRRLLAMTEPVAPDEAMIQRARALAAQAGENNLQPAEPERPTCPPPVVCPPPPPPCPTCPPPVVQRVSPGPLPFVLTGAGAALLLTGGLFYGYALDAAATYAQPDTPVSVRLALRDRGEAFRWVGLFGILLGLGSEAAGLYFFARPLGQPTAAPAAAAESPRSRRTPLGPAITAFGASPEGIFLGGRF